MCIALNEVFLHTDGDYSGLPVTVTFLTGDTEPRATNIAIVDDDLVEMTETISLQATTTDANSMISPNTATVFIIDNDGNCVSVCVQTVELTWISS